MKIKLLVFFLLLYTLGYSKSLNAQTALIIGANAQYSFLQTKANFSALPNVPRPNLPTSDINSNSYALAAFAEYNFWESLSLGLNLAYNPIDNNFENYENSIIGIDGVPTPIQFKHSLNSSIDYISIFPYLNINLWELANLRLGSRLFF